MPRTNRIRRNPQAAPNLHLYPGVRGFGGRLSFQEVGKMAKEHTSYDESLPFRVRPAPNRQDYRGEACYPDMEAAQAHATDLAIRCGVGSVVLNILTGRVMYRAHVPPRARKA